MKVRIKKLGVATRKNAEILTFAKSVTFLYGPVGKGKSSVARLVDYCLGGTLERTPAIQQEFVSAELAIDLGEYECTLERGAADTQGVRVSWSRGCEDIESVNAPLIAGDSPIFGASIYNLSDLLFYLCGIEPIKVRQRSRDPDSPMIRLSFRDIWRYCYLDQTHLDSSFFRLEDPYRGRKSQDAMRFFTGLHSERLSQLEVDLYRATDEQHGKREAANQVRKFMDRFELGSELDVSGQIDEVRDKLRSAEAERTDLEEKRYVVLHPTEPMRQRLRILGDQIAELLEAISATEEAVAEQRALRAELITAKVKADRSEQAGRVLSGVDYERCPECATDISSRRVVPHACKLCGSDLVLNDLVPSEQMELVRRELNDRIDQIGDSIQRRERALARSLRQLEQIRAEKIELDKVLQHEVSRYDSAYVESVRLVDREVATLSERLRSLEKLQKMPQAISELEEQAGALQAKIDQLRHVIEVERSRLRQADENVGAIEDLFKSIMLSVGFPGVTEEDKVELDTRNWRPAILHEGQEWTFWDIGSGGKKTLFNVCYALALHEAAKERGMPVPSILIIDSPTKNISDHENPDLVKALYQEIYRLVSAADERGIQFLLIDSALVVPEIEIIDFSFRRFAGEPDAPSLISYYVGP